MDPFEHFACFGKNWDQTRRIPLQNHLDVRFKLDTIAWLAAVDREYFGEQAKLQRGR